MKELSLLLAAALAALPGCGPDTDPPAPETTWKQAFDASSVGWLLDVAGPPGGDLLAVGGSPDAGLIYRGGGTSWAPESLPAVPLLNWAHGFSASDITVVGNGGTVIHHDGSSWTVQETPTDAPLWGVWGASPDDLWAVGGTGQSGDLPVLIHYDGSSWSTATIPTLQKAKVQAFFKVWGTDANNVYVVGQRGVVLHHDGSAWTEELVGASDDLISIWGTGPDQVVAVGGRGNGIVSRFDGASWHTKSLAPMPGLNGVFLRTPEVIHVVGILGTIARLDGASLELLDEAKADTKLDLHSVFGDAQGRLTAVGGSLASTKPPYQGIALTRDLLPEE